MHDTTDPLLVLGTTLLSLTEAASILNKDASTLRRKISEGQLDAKKIGKTWCVRSADIALLKQAQELGR